MFSYKGFSIIEAGTTGKFVITPDATEFDLEGYATKEDAMRVIDVLQTKQEIQEHAKLSAYGANGELDCMYPVGSSAYLVWKEAYKEACNDLMDEADAIYDYYNKDLL